MKKKKKKKKKIPFSHLIPSATPQAPIIYRVEEVRGLDYSLVISLPLPKRITKEDIEVQVDDETVLVKLPNRPPVIEGFILFIFLENDGCFN